MYINLSKTKKAKDIYNCNGVTNRAMFVKCLKIFFMHLYFGYPITGVVDELIRSEELRNFVKIYEVPSAEEVYEIFNRYNSENYCNIVNSILKTFYNPKKRGKNTYIGDATHVTCDINVLRKYIAEEKLQELGLYWGFSTTKGHYIGYKVTVVLYKGTCAPI